MNNPKRLASIVQLVRQAVREIATEVGGDDLESHDVGDWVRRRVAAHMPDCTPGAMLAAIRFEQVDFERRRAILDAVHRIAGRMSKPPKDSESISEVVARAARAGDQEALELLPRLDAPLERSYLRATGN